MGFFRRYKLTDYTADECRAALRRLEESLWGPEYGTQEAVIHDLEEWACFRELLARHEKVNQSPIDSTSKDYVRQLVFDIVQLSSARLTAPKLVLRMKEYGIGERATREAMQYLVDAGKLTFNKSMSLIPNFQCPYVSHADDCDCQGMGGDR